MSKKQVSATEFANERMNGATVKELADKFGISQANCKAIISHLALPKRAVSPGYELVDDRISKTTEDATTDNSYSETVSMH